MTKPTGKKRGRPRKDAPKAAEPSVSRAAAKLTGDADAEQAPKTPQERQREWRARKKDKASAPPEVITVDESDVAVAAEVGGVLWDIVGPMVRCRALDDEQRLRLGRALAPLIKKYLPLLADWQYEAAAILCVMALARETKLPNEPKPEGEDTDGMGQNIRIVE